MVPQLQSIHESSASPASEKISKAVEAFAVCQGDDANEGKDSVEGEEALEARRLEDDDRATEILKPFASIGSYRHRHADNGNSGMSGVYESALSPDITGPGLPRVNSTPVDWKPESMEDETTKLERELQKQRSLSSSGEETIEESLQWQRSRTLLDEANEMTEINRDAKAVGRSVSDCGDRTWPQQNTARTRSRTRSLTDEDLDELRGCIDLGFGFNVNEGQELCNTLPALELCYAITRQYNDRTSPSSTLGRGAIDGSSSSNSSYNTFPMEPWRIFSPGDHPSQVKTKLRHWAQAVACTVRQSC